MADISELISRLQSSEWEERRDAARALGSVEKEHQEEAVRALKDRLAVEDDGDIIEAIVKALAQMGALDNEVISLLRRRLETDEHPFVIREVIIGLHQAGTTVEQMSRILARNPHFPVAWRDEWHYLWHHGGVVGQVIEHTLHQRWWRLPVDFRRHFGPPWLWGDPWYHHCPKCHIMWHELVHLLEQRGGSRQEAEWLIATMMRRWCGSPGWHFARHDFEELMSLRVEQNVVYEEQNVLRFRYLDAFATDPKERPIAEWARDWLGPFQQDWDELLRTEEQFDGIRDEISDLKRQQEEIIREAERQRERRPLEPGEPLPQELQGRWNEVAERLKHLEGDVEPGEVQRLRRQLEEATEKLLPQLRERGVRFRFVEIEGVLGEYNFYERKVTLYPPMIELAADELSTQLHRPKQEVYDDLYTITEMHETTHATTHLGIDTNGNLWEHPEQGTSELHELLAQLYTIHLIRRLQNTRLEQVFLELNKHQPERYRYWQVLQDVPLEMARTFLTGKRIGWFRWDLLSLAREAAEIVGSAVPLLRRVLQPQETQAFIDGMGPILARLESASTRRELGDAAAAFLDHCDSHPLVRAILERALAKGPYSSEYRKLLLASTLVEGPRVGAPTLRLTIDQIENARTVALMQNDLVLRNEIIHGLRVAEELRAMAQPVLATPEEIIQAIKGRLPDEKQEALRIIERLREWVEQR